MEAVSYQNAVVLGFIPLNGSDEFRLRWGYLLRSFQVLLINSLNLTLGVAVDKWQGQVVLLLSFQRLQPKTPERMIVIRQALGFRS